MFICVDALQCVFCVYFYMHKDQIYSHECKDEVNCEPEVLTALKVSTEGKGYYTMGTMAEVG